MESQKVGLRIGEALVYAIGKTLYEGGLQGQVLLQDMGRQIVDRLAELREIETVSDPVTMARSLSKFFSSKGLLDEMVLSEEDGEVTMLWRNWRILSSIKSLLSKGCTLVPCPLTIAIHSIFREKGYALQPLTELEILDDSRRVARQKFRLIDLKGRSFEEVSEQISGAMDAELHRR